MTPFELKWQAPEFEYREKGISWYWISIIIAAVLVGVSAWQKNFLFGFFIVAAEILILAWANREPPLVEFILNEKGIRIGEHKFHAYAEIESFSSNDHLESDWPDIFFQFHKSLRPALKIKIPKERAAEIQKILKAVMPQVEHKHSMLDTLEEFVGF